MKKIFTLIKVFLWVVMDNRAIGLIDSGVGGFTVLKELQNYFPNENFIYFGDSKNMPYGEKSNEDIIKLVNNGIEFLIQKEVKFIILACNTASSLIDKLSSSVKLFSIIEAGCLASLDFEKQGKIGLIATRATVNNKTYEEQLEKISSDLSFVSYGTQDLARVINNQLDEINLLKKNIHQAIDPILKQTPVKHLLLGCTHFPIVSETIRELYPEIHLIDPAQKESQLVQKFIIENDLENTSNREGKTIIYLRQDHDDLISKRLLKELNINFESLNFIN